MTGSERRRIPRRAADSITGVAFEDAFVALTDGILISDGNGNVLSANPAAFRLLGEDELLEVPGMGPARIERYGRDLLELVRAGAGTGLPGRPCPYDARQ